jgi:hypothetical protein
MVQYEAKTKANIPAGIGVAGAALTLFAHSRPTLSLSDRLKPVILDWQAWTRGFWDISAGLTGADLSASLRDGLTLSTCLIVMALAVKRSLPFQERAPRLLSLSFLEYFSLYLLLTALFVAVPSIGTLINPTRRVPCNFSSCCRSLRSARPTPADGSSSTRYGWRWAVLGSFGSSIGCRPRTFFTRRSEPYLSIARQMPDARILICCPCWEAAG